MSKVTVTSKDGVQLWTHATIKGGGIAREATERQLREFASAKPASELREDEYFDVDEWADEVRAVVASDIPLDDLANVPLIDQFPF